MPERFGEMLQKALAGTLFASRWLLAPFYLGIVLGVVILLTKFLQELWHLMLSAFSGTEADVILGLLLGNLALTGSLLLISYFRAMRISSPRSTTRRTANGRNGWGRSISPPSS